MATKSASTKSPTVRTTTSSPSIRISPHRSTRNAKCPASVASHRWASRRPKWSILCRRTESRLWTANRICATRWTRTTRRRSRRWKCSVFRRIARYRRWVLCDCRLKLIANFFDVFLRIYRDANVSMMSKRWMWPSTRNIWHWRAEKWPSKRTSLTIRWEDTNYWIIIVKIYVMFVFSRANRAWTSNSKYTNRCVYLSFFFSIDDHRTGPTTSGEYVELIMCMICCWTK